jgi:hypothetical protein
MVVVERTEAWEADAALTEAASVALLTLKPRGYLKSALKGSLGRRKGGCTGFSVRRPLPHEPAQKEDASLRSIQMPSKEVSFYQVTISLVHHCCDDGSSQSAHTENPGQLSP